MKKVAIIGAGMAGLTCGQTLHAAGFDVTVFEKSRGLGGRLATRRAEQLRFDHGAQYVTARTPEFAAFMAQATSLGSAAVWRPTANIDGNVFDKTKNGEEPWYVGTPGMSGLIAPLADGLTVVKGKTVSAIRHTQGAWTFTSAEGGDEGGFEALVLAIPVEQAKALLGEHTGEHFQELEDAKLAPCLSAMALFKKPTNIPFDCFRDASQTITWMARNDTKPQRPTDDEQWVFHASPEWSLTHLEKEKEDIAQLILAEVARQIGPLPDTSYLSGHRWRYAFVDRALGKPFLYAPELRIGLAGDWCLAPRVEAAFTSGLSLANEIIAHSAP